MSRRTNRALKVAQFDQTSVLATSIMWRSEEVRRPVTKPVQLPLTSEVQHGNRIDCSIGAVFARWWGLGILSLGLARSQEERVTMLLDTICGIHEGRSTLEIDSRTHLSGYLTIISQST